MNLWLIFLTGLTTGGLTCLAVQGGLLVTAMTRLRGKVQRVFTAVTAVLVLALGFIATGRRTTPSAARGLS